jgi:hypothetical protein
MVGRPIVIEDNKKEVLSEKEREKKNTPNREERNDLVDTDRSTHGSLDVEGLDVLPALLQKGDEEVDATLDVGLDLLLSEGDVGDGNTKAERLLHLELDLRLELKNLSGKVISVLDDGRELTGTVEGRTVQLGNLTKHSLASKEAVVLLAELLHGLLVTADGLQTVNTHAGQTELLGLIKVNLVTKDANLDVLLAGVGQTDNTAETLVLLNIPVLKTDLELDGLDEVPLAALSHDGVDGFLESGGADLAGHCDRVTLKSNR